MSTGVVVLAVALLLVAALLVLVLQEMRRTSRATREPLTRLDARVESLSGQLGARLGESTETARAMSSMVGQQLVGANRSLSELAERLGRLDEATRQIERVGRSISGLEQLLASPKLRGGLGEWSLESLLSEVLPAGQVERQYRLGSRDVIVDIAIRAPEGRLLTIDSKFPLEAFRRLADAESVGEDTTSRRRELHRAVRARVDEIAEKYISPEDGTLDFALMFIPSESIYYELAVRDEAADFLAYSLGRRVFPCSPNTLYAYLQTILLGLRGLRIAEHAREIHAALQHLGQDAARVRGLFDRAATQLRNAGQNVEAAGAALSRLEARLEAITRTEPGNLEAPERPDPSAPLLGEIGGG